SSRLRHAGYILPVAFAPDGRSFASAGSDAVRVWETATGKRLRQLDLRTGRDLHYTADGRELLLLTDGPTLDLRAVDPATGRELRHVTLAKGGTQDGIVFSASGRRMAVSFIAET